MKSYPGQSVPADRRDLHLWLRRLRRLVADTPADVRVYVAADSVRVTLGCDPDAPSQDFERNRAEVDSFIASRWQEDCP